MISLIDILLKEDLLYSYRDKYEVYMNPKSISRMGPNMRGISDSTGNLYVLDDSGLTTLHGNIFNSLKSKGYLSGDFGNSIENLDIITWERDKKTNDFYLSTSFPELSTLNGNDMKKLDALINRVKSKNPILTFNKKHIYE